MFQGVELIIVDMCYLCHSLGLRCIVSYIIISGSSKYAVSGDKKEQTTRVDAFMLVLYVFTMIGLLTAMILAIYLF